VAAQEIEKDFGYLSCAKKDNRFHETLEAMVLSAIRSVTRRILRKIFKHRDPLWHHRGAGRFSKRLNQLFGATRMLTLKEGAVYSSGTFAERVLSH
jgi:hypothetical protein